MNYFKYLSIIILTVLAAGCGDFEDFVVTDKPYVDYTSVQLYVGEHAGDRGSFQLVGSPAGAGYVWTSEDPSIVTVDQTGLIKAVKEGLTSIVLSSKDDKVIIDVSVKEYIPLTGFDLSTNSVIGFWQETTRVFLTPIPANATDADKIEWTSSNGTVAIAYNNGLIKTLEEGRATVTAKYGNIEQQVNVWVPAPPVKMDKSGWSVPGYNSNSNDGTIGYSSQQVGDGAGIPGIIDDDLGTYWHARYGSPASAYPHWFIIDLGEEVTIAQVGMARRNNDGRGQKGYQVFTCTEDGATNLSDPTIWAWEDQGDKSFNSGVNGIQVVAMGNFPLARYVKVYMDAKYRGDNDYAMVGDFSVYIFQD
ncbi:MAG: Ig-like domain-containing protein [Prevotella sp.]|jgi:hypothetical protein|nr:Ig-like domain-containing protein [Prevotella sp.]